MDLIFLKIVPNSMFISVFRYIRHEMRSKFRNHTIYLLTLSHLNPLFARVYRTDKGEL